MSIIFSYIYNLFQTMNLALGSIRVTDVVDISIVAFIIYIVLIFAKKTKSFFVINSIIALLVVSSLAQYLDLGLTREILQPLLTFSIIIIVVVYQREIRNLFDWFSLSSRNLMFLKKISTTSEISSILVKALTAMADEKIGAIIVLEGEYPLEGVVNGGFQLEGKVSVPLIMSIFDHHTPGHDGAVLIRNNQIGAFGLHLPLAQKYTKYSEFGTRHRAAAGITENTDALALVVSEERGIISWAENGQLKKIEDREELENIIRTFLKENIVETKVSFWRSLTTDHLLIKLMSFCLSISLWFIFIYHVGIVTREFSLPIEFKNIPKDETVSLIKPKTVEVSLIGKSSDFTDFDPQNIVVTVDVSQGVPKENSNEETVKITKDMIVFPNYFSIDTIRTTDVSFIIGTTTTPNSK
jgi:diadenylate cyclase